jgi:hypothetical protein
LAIVIAVAESRFALAKAAFAASATRRCVRRFAAGSAAAAVAQAVQRTLAAVCDLVITIRKVGFAPGDVAATSFTLRLGVGQLATVSADSAVAHRVQARFATVVGRFIAVDVVGLTARDQTRALRAHGAGIGELAKRLAVGFVDLAVAIIVASVAGLATTFWTIGVLGMHASRVAGCRVGIHQSPQRGVGRVVHTAAGVERAAAIRCTHGVLLSAQHGWVVGVAAHAPKKHVNRYEPSAAGRGGADRHYSPSSEADSESASESAEVGAVGS